MLEAPINGQWERQGIGITLAYNVLLSVQLGLLPAPCLREVVFLCAGTTAGQALREVIIALPPGAKHGVDNWKEYHVGTVTCTACDRDLDSFNCRLHVLSACTCTVTTVSSEYSTVLGYLGRSKDRVQGGKSENERRSHLVAHSSTDMTR